MTTTESAPRYVNQFALVRGVRFALKARPGIFQAIINERTLGGREIVRAREVHPYESEMFGPVIRVHWTEVFEIL